MNYWRILILAYTIKETSQFRKDLKLCKKKNLDFDELRKVINYLSEGKSIPAKYLDHPLKPSKQFMNCRELHIKPDWLLIYKYSNDKVILYLIRTGSHSNLFE